MKEMKVHYRRRYLWTCTKKSEARRQSTRWVLCTYRTHDDGHEKIAGRELRLLWCSRQLFGRRSPSIIDGHIHTVFKVVSYRVLDARWLSWTESKTSSRHLSESVGSSMWSWFGGYHHRWTQHRCWFYNLAGFIIVAETRNRQSKLKIQLKHR